MKRSTTTTTTKAARYALPEWRAHSKALARQSIEYLDSCLQRLDDPDYLREHAIADLQQLRAYLLPYAQGDL